MSSSTCKCVEKASRINNKSTRSNQSKYAPNACSSFIRYTSIYHIRAKGGKEEQKKKMANACLFYSQTHASRLNSEVQNRKKRKINGRFITHSEFIQ